MSVSGVRFSAVIFALLFSLWPEHFVNGYLGIDMFFVATGFLTHLALSAQKISFSSALAFYFQGIRHFIPLYLLLILLSAFIKTLIYDRMDSSQIDYKILSAATFTSNFFGLQHHENTTIKNAFVFHHTWPVSVVVQFSAIVPAVYSIYTYLSSMRKTLGATFVMALGMMSLTFQTCHEDVVATAETHFFSRLWQFLLGFLTYALKQHDFEQFQSLPTKKEASRTSTSLQYIFNIQNLVIILLFGQLTLPIMTLAWSKRLVISMTMSMLLYHCKRGPTECYIVELLDSSSYWMYLIYWPTVSVVDRFYLDSGAFGNYDKIALLGIIISLGIIVEHLREHLTRWLENCSQLVALLAILYTTTVLMAFFTAGFPKTHIETNTTLKYYI